MDTCLETLSTLQLTSGESVCRRVYVQMVGMSIAVDAETQTLVDSYRVCI